MNNDSQKDGLQVEHYDAAEVDAKRRKILKRVGIGIGAASLLTALGYFALVKEEDKKTKPTARDAKPKPPYLVPDGGMGAWSNSTVVFSGDKNE